MSVDCCSCPRARAFQALEAIKKAGWEYQVVRFGFSSKWSAALGRGEDSVVSGFYDSIEEAIADVIDKAKAKSGDAP